MFFRLYELPIEICFQSKRLPSVAKIPAPIIAIPAMVIVVDVIKLRLRF